MLQQMSCSDACDMCSELTPVMSHCSVLQHSPIMSVVLCCRCTIQLTILGYILVPIFSYDKWWLVLLYASFMITIAGAEAVSRPSAVYQVPYIP